MESLQHEVFESFFEEIKEKAKIVRKINEPNKLDLFVEEYSELRIMIKYFTNVLFYYISNDDIRNEFSLTFFEDDFESQIEQLSLYLDK